MDPPHVTTFAAPRSELQLARENWRARPRQSGKISHLLAAELRRQILRDELPAGQHLPPEAELAAALDVSRETLREALRILESQSLVDIRRGRGGGAVVRRPGLESVGRYVAMLLQLRRTTLADLEEARSVIEPPAAEQFALRSGTEEIDQLVLFHYDERVAVGDPLSFVGAVGRFDQAVTELSGNRSLGVIAGVLRGIYAGQAYAALGTSDPAAATRIASGVIAGHEAFVQAALRHDGALAKEAWTTYLLSTCRLLRTRSQSRQPIDVVPLWRAEVGRAGNEQVPGMATAVATEIRSRIVEGRLGDGDRLPPLPQLADEFEISRPTLREALRILETEYLLDLRSGDRGGARVRHPSTQVAAQLAGTIFEARQTTLADFYRALRLIEPAVMELAASRIDPESIRALRALEAVLSASTDDIPRFVGAWTQGRAVAFTATRNPALGVIAELLQWVSVGTQPAVTAEAASDLPWVRNTHRMAQLFGELVTAFEAGDSSWAGSIWDTLLDLNRPYIESSELGRRLMIDLID